jgi:hypothetical protein
MTPCFAQCNGSFSLKNPRPKDVDLLQAPHRGDLSLAPKRTGPPSCATALRVMDPGSVARLVFLSSLDIVRTSGSFPDPNQVLSTQQLFDQKRLPRYGTGLTSPTPPRPKGLGFSEVLNSNLGLPKNRGYKSLESGSDDAPM